MKRRRCCAPRPGPPSRRAGVRCIIFLALGGAPAAAVDRFALTPGSVLKWVKATDTREGHAAACLRNGLDPTPSEVLLSDQVDRHLNVACHLLPGEVSLSRLLYGIVENGHRLRPTRCSSRHTPASSRSQAHWMRYAAGHRSSRFRAQQAKFRCRKRLLFAQQHSRDTTAQERAPDLTPR